MPRKALPALAVLPLLLSGCFETDDSEGTLVLRFATWVLLIPLVVGVASLAGGLIARFKYGVKGRWGIIPFVVFAVAVGIFFPNMVRDRVTVTPTEIEQTTGFWFAPTRKGFRYDEVRSVRRKKTITAKGVPNEKWIILYKDGREETLDPGDLWERSGDLIVPRLRSHGVRIQ